MVDALLSLFPQAPYRNVALQCLTEVGAQQAQRRLTAPLFLTRVSCSIAAGVHLMSYVTHLFVFNSAPCMACSPALGFLSCAGLSVHFLCWAYTHQGFTFFIGQASGLYPAGAPVAAH
jgi:hypothetical protein